MSGGRGGGGGRGRGAGGGGGGGGGFRGRGAGGSNRGGFRGRGAPRGAFFRGGAQPARRHVTGGAAAGAAAGAGPEQEQPATRQQVPNARPQKKQRVGGSEDGAAGLAAVPSSKVTKRPDTTDDDHAVGGDDLEANYALSDSDGGGSDSEAELADDVDVPSGSDDEEETKSASTKRKRTAPPSAKAVERLAKLKMVRKEKGDAEAAKAGSFAEQPPAAQAAELWRLFASEFKDSLSAIELDAQLPATQFVSLDYHDDSRFPDAVNQLIPRAQQRFGQAGLKDLPAGSPILIVVCLSAIRCTEILAALAPLHTRAAKLFGKHLDVKEQTEMLKGRFGVAVGTPARIHKLLDLGALSLAHCTTIVLDMHPDTKRFTLLTMPAVRTDLLKLMKDHLRAQLATNKLRIAMY